jgi:transposase
MTAVMIGIDPHKGSHTAVAISVAEAPLGDLRVRASVAQAGQLVAWAASWPERTWAVEGAGGLGHLLAQQLVAAGEQVLDVAPKLAARVRLLQTGDTNKNDPNDALSVAVAALRSRTRRPVAAEDHAAVLKVWAKRHRDLARSRNQVACRLHAVLCELLAGARAGPGHRLGDVPLAGGHGARPGATGGAGGSFVVSVLARADGVLVGVDDLGSASEPAGRAAEDPGPRESGPRESGMGLRGSRTRPLVLTWTFTRLAGIRG